MNASSDEAAIAAAAPTNITIAIMIAKRARIEVPLILTCGKISAKRHHPEVARALTLRPQRSIIARTFCSNTAISKGLVTISMPGAKYPCPTTAFSANR